jgi:hypothetical protein
MRPPPPHRKDSLRHQAALGCLAGSAIHTPLCAAPMHAIPARLMLLPAEQALQSLVRCTLPPGIHMLRRAPSMSYTSLLLSGAAWLQAQYRMVRLSAERAIVGAVTRLQRRQWWWLTRSMTATARLTLRPHTGRPTSMKRATCAWSSAAACSGPQRGVACAVTCAPTPRPLPVCCSPCLLRLPQRPALSGSQPV